MSKEITLPSGEKMIVDDDCVVAPVDTLQVSNAAATAKKRYEKLLELDAKLSNK